VKVAVPEPPVIVAVDGDTVRPADGLGVTVTVPVNPLTGATVTVTVVVLPTVTVTLVGLAEIVKSVTVSMKLAVDPVWTESPA